jgi:glycyl-tRNA synthetase beta chain
MMDRELLLEIGCEELPAGWLPALTNQIGDVLVGQLRAHRLVPESPAETFSTPRRLTVRIVRVPERQTDLEEVLNGPAVSAGFKPDGAPTPAAIGFAAKQGVDVSVLERVRTSKGEYLAFRNRQRGKTATDVLPDVLGGALRGLSFPKSMRWDATLEDGRGDLLFGRPIRWILYLFGGRVVPFTITRSAAAQTSQVQDVVSGAVTYGHRFLTTSGRAGRAIKVRSFDEYRARLLENFVVLERGERHDKIARELDAKAQRLQGRVSHAVRSESDLLREVPDLVEYPSVVGGTFGIEFLDLPEEVLTTTLIHHQHYFPVEAEGGRLKNAFLAVINTEPDNERTIARNAERVVTARLRDARFFWEADRTVPLESRIERLSTLLFHRKLGTYRQKSERIERLAAWIAKDAIGARAGTAAHAAQAARLAKADLTTDMVRELTELQGIMGGIYAREEGLPEEVWKAIYFHYLPIGVEVDAPPTSAQLGEAAAAWAAVSIADKLDTIVGLFAAGEKPTGSRDPYGLRRAAHGVLRVLIDLQALTGATARPTIGALLREAAKGFPQRADWREWPREDIDELNRFLIERLRNAFEVRGADRRLVRAVTWENVDAMRPAEAAAKLQALPDFISSPEFAQLARAFKRVKNIAGELKDQPPIALDALSGTLTEPAERDLLQGLIQRVSKVHDAADRSDYRSALAELAALGPAVDRFFVDVLVMADDPMLRAARLSLMAHVRDTVRRIADVSEIVADEKQT